MKEYTVMGHVAGSKSLGSVWANTLQEAYDLVCQRDDLSVSLCHQCAGECEDPEIDQVTIEPTCSDELAETFDL